MIEVCVPATSANCCLGFDSMGLALNWQARFRAEKSEEWKIEGCPPAYQNMNNLVIVSYLKTLKVLGLEEQPIHLVIDSDIPFARGLGSSSTCVVAGILLATHLNDAKCSKETLLEIATEIEGHPDNVAPALLGGLVCCFTEQEKIGFSKRKLYDWNMLAIVPDYPIETKEARKVLPASVTLKQAANQVGRALVFVEALEKGESQKAIFAAKDALHEPYRKDLIKDYPAIKEACDEKNILLWISGSGSTLLALSQNKSDLKELEEWVLQDFPSFDCRMLKPDERGAQIRNA